MLKRIKRFATRVKCAFALFMLRNLVLSTKTRAELEEYIERRQLLLSSWTREVDKHGDHTPWYKLAAYLDSSFYTDEVWQESDSWCLIHYLNNYEAVYELPSYGFSFIFNRSGRIRPKSSLDSGYSSLWFEMLALVRLIFVSLSKMPLQETSYWIDYLCYYPKARLKMRLK